MKSNYGKVLYVDFWASWCKPCRALFPASKSLKKELKNSGTEFIYISIDKVASDWTAAVDMEMLAPDNNYLTNRINNDFLKSLKISTIPRYMIFDKQGKLVNDNAPRPDDPSLKQLLQNLSLK